MTAPVSIIFTHIPKTAGRSFITNIVKDNFSANEIHEFRGLKDLITAQFRPHRIFLGHTQYGVHTLINGPSQYVTMLRDPVNRAVSYYYFVRRARSENYEHPHWRLANELDLSAFCQHAWFRNVETRSLAGFFCDRIALFGNDKFLNKLILNQAMRHLNEKYLFGLQERYEESVAYITKSLHWKTPKLADPFNINDLRPQLEDIPQADLQSIEEANQLDMALYRYAECQFTSLMQLQKKTSALAETNPSQQS
jgi:hypothetical protein